MFVIKQLNNFAAQLTSRGSLILFNVQIKNLVHDHAPRRAILYVPGDSERKLKKACMIKADCIAMDCEDGVALNKKTTARETIHNLLNEGKPKHTYTDWAVRINSVESGLCSDDLKAILSAKNLPDTILLPKIDTIGHLKWFSENLKLFMRPEEKINLVMLIESARSMINLVDICRHAQETASNFIPTTLIFGSDDFCANIGAVRTDDQIEILYARQKMVLVAKAFGLQAIDMVYINYKDLTGLQKQCEQGMRMGYTGKQVIHPDQVPVVQKYFLPNEQQVKWARGLIQKFNEHQKSGVGAFNYEGNMIDMPTLRIAENIVKLMEIENKTKNK